MACYIVSYDLAEPGNYAPLHERLKAYGTWAKITESTWAIVSDQPASGIRDTLHQLLKPGDKLFVVRSGVEAAWSGLGANSGAWLKKYL